MKPFDYSIPSVFSIDTPFQALCAIAAIKQLHINDYIILAYFPRDEIRNAQLRAVLEKYGVTYKVSKPFNRIAFKYAKWSALRKHHTHYKRLFIGDFRDMMLYYSSLRYISDGAHVVYLDDGSITISLLNDIINDPLDEDSQLFLDELESKRSILTNKNILTIYDHIENPKYNIENLDLNLIMPQKYKTQECEGVYIVGTNLESYSEALDIPVEAYIKKLDILTANLRYTYPEEKVVFIPHGKDTSNYAVDICNRHGVAFEPSEMTIELKLLNLQKPPKAVYGFTSSALYNIKKIFPQTRVVNILYEGKKNNPFYQEYLTCSEYYLQNGIELVKESLS